MPLQYNSTDFWYNMSYLQAAADVGLENDELSTPTSAHSKTALIVFI